VISSAWISGFRGMKRQDGYGGSTGFDSQILRRSSSLSWCLSTCVALPWEMTLCIVMGLPAYADSRGIFHQLPTCLNVHGCTLQSEVTTDR
jgi:hypothetical protein